jgi:hypothetical protein
MHLDHSEDYFIPTTRAFTLAVVLLLSIILAYSISYHSRFLPLFILLVLVVYFLRLSYLSIIPFVFAAFISSDHIIQFRISTPWGLMHPSIIIIAFTIILTFFRKYAFTAQSFILPRLVLISFIMFSLSLGFSVLLNGADLDALMWVSILVLGSGGVYFIAANHSNHKIDGMRLLKIISGVATVVSILAIIEYLSGYNPFSALHQSNEHWIGQPFDVSYIGRLVRVRSSVGHPLVLSAFLVFILPVSLYFAFRSEKKLFWVISTVIQYLGIFVTFSRSAYLFGVLILLIYLIRFNVISFKYLIQLIGLLTLTALSGYFLLYRNEITGEFLERISLQTGTASFLFRIEGWFLAGDFISKSPYFGIGVRQLPILIENALPWFPLTTFDNTFLDLFCEIGIVGFFSYIVFILSPMIPVIRSEDNEFGRFLPLIVLLTMIYFSFVFTVVYHQIIWITYWTLQGLFLMIRTTVKNEV